MEWGFAFGLITVGAIVCAILIWVDSVNEESKILKTKILKTDTVGTVGIIHTRICRETTFVVYYKDGTHKIVTEATGNMGYKMYLKYLEV